MAAIQNFKNFLRHGKQARAAHSPHAEPTTNVSTVHAQQQRYNNYAPPPQDHAHAMSDPNVMDHKPLHANVPQADYSAAAVNNQNQAARAGDAAARAAGDQQKAQAAAKAKKEIDPEVLERIVAEEREAKGKLPKYPGLERWILLEKMGDGAFSNVYRAKDSEGQYPECAIKVVRKFEMNSSQVSGRLSLFFSLSCFVSLPMMRVSSYRPLHAQLRLSFQPCDHVANAVGA